MHRILWNQRGNRHMRPRQRSEIQKHQLRILDLSRSDGDAGGLGDLAWCGHPEGRHEGARTRAGGVDDRGWIVQFADRNDDGVFHLFDPEGGRHLDGVRVGT